MSRTGTCLAAVLALAMASPVATGQARPKSAPKGKPAPTFTLEPQEEGRVVRGVEVAPDPRAVTEVHQYPVDFQGPTAMGVTVFVPKVVLYSDGRMRWYFSFWNRSKESQTLFFDFEESFVADAESRPYPQVARQVVGGNRGSIYMVAITSDRRLDTWIDFRAPERPATQFKVGIMLEQRYDHRADAFRPFVVELTESLPPALKKVKLAVEKDDVGPRPGGARGAVGERPGGLTPEVDGGFEEEPEPRPTVAAAEAVRAAAEEGRRYEGNIRGAEGASERGGIQFERRSRDRLPAATIFRNSRPLKDIWLIGAYFEQKAAPGGLVLRFEDSRKVEYAFTIEKNNLNGKDTEGNSYTFTLCKK